MSALSTYAPVFLRSIILAGVATVVCLVMAYPISYFMSRMKAGRQKVMMMIIMLPMWMNFLLRTYAWMSLLERNGLINKFFAMFGVGPFNMINTNGAVILGMVYNYLPFMILPLYSTMVKIDHSLIEAAQDLGGNLYNVLTKVLIPLSIPGITTGITMVLSVLLSLEQIGQKVVFDWKATVIFVLIAITHIVWKKLKKKAPSPIILILISAGLGMLFYGLIP
jgi:spermidine/putrescine transport system permease protein